MERGVIEKAGDVGRHQISESLGIHVKEFRLCPAVATKLSVAYLHPSNTIHPP